MSSPFTGLTPAGNANSPATNWSVVPQGLLPSPFIPFPNLGQPGTDEVGYGEGGYGEDGYDTPSIPGSAAPTTDWTIYTLK